MKTEFVKSKRHCMYRYHPPCIKIKEIIDSGVLGQIVSIEHRENVGFWHFAHSFVRGNWRNEASSSFALLAKCCHDLDLITYWMGADKKCEKIQSFGDLFHFRKEQKPEKAGDFCLECGVEPNCPYSAQKIYLKNRPNGPKWPHSVVYDIEDAPGGYFNGLKEALRKGPYGRCVYECDNDVVDHQTVNMAFEGGATATVTMCGFTDDCNRETRICGTMGELFWDGSNEGGMKVIDFRDRSVKQIEVDFKAPEGARTSGHGGADFYLMNAVTKAVANNDPGIIYSGIRESLRSHKLVFAAERSRHNDSVEMCDF